MPKLLSYKKVNPRKFKPDFIIKGYRAEKEMPEDYVPYLVRGQKQCRRFVSGIGFQQINEVMILR